MLSSEELRNAINSDSSAARHYAGFDLSSVRTRTLENPRSMYVSYRIGDEIFWTRKPLYLRAGELLITDGTNEARTRCGNRVSATPQLPVSSKEPAVQAFEAEQNLAPPAAEEALPLQPFAVPGTLSPRNEFVRSGTEGFVAYDVPPPWVGPYPPPIIPPSPPPGPPPVPPPTPPTVTPEPGTGVLLILAVAGGWLAWKIRGKTMA